MTCSALEEVLQRYDTAVGQYTNTSISHAGAWHQADIAEFKVLFELLLPHAQDGEPLAQYAVATILWLGMRCASQQEQFDNYRVAVAGASTWWEAAARQGHMGALDNLLTSGVGEEADRIRVLAEGIKSDQPELVSWSDGVPTYGSAYFTELFIRTYATRTPGDAQPHARADRQRRR